MVKQKASASSATRKKHLKKQAGDAADVAPVGPAQRGQKKEKRSRFEPKVKSYTPPAATPKGIPDPVDIYLFSSGGGSSGSVDPELIVILRKLAKRDESTVAKGVEGLDAWVREVMELDTRSGEAAAEADEDWILEKKRDELVESMAVWAHHFAHLSLHPSRRLRLQTHSLHALLTSHSPSSLIVRTREALLSSMWLDQMEYVGSWAVGAWDGDRGVRNISRRAWDAVVILPSATKLNEVKVSEEEELDVKADGIQLGEYAESILLFAKSLILLPAVTPSTPDTPLDTEEEDPTLLKTQALLALSYLVKTLPAPLEQHLSKESLHFLQSESIWMLLDGAGAAMMRRAAYELLGSIVERTEIDILSPPVKSAADGEDDDEDEEEEGGLEVVARYVLLHCWNEEEGWAGVIAFLRRYPQAWALPLDQNTEVPEPTESTSDGFVPSASLALFLSHLRSACSALPSNYPTLLLLLATLPTTVLPRNREGLMLLFDAFWKPWKRQDRSLVVGGVRAVGELVGAILECLVWEIGGVLKAGNIELAHEIAHIVVGRVWSAYLGIEDPVVEGVKVVARRVKGMSEDRVGRELKAVLERLASRNLDVFEATWETIQTTALAVLIRGASSASTSIPALASGLLLLSPVRTSSVSISTAAQSVLESATSLSVKAVQVICARLAEEITLSSEGQVVDDCQVGQQLLSCLFKLRRVVETDPETVVVIDAVSRHLLGVALCPAPIAIVTDSFAILSQHLSSTLTPSTSRKTLWTAIVSLLQQGVSAVALQRLVDALEDGSFPRDLECAELDSHIAPLLDRVFGDAVQGTLQESEVIEKLVYSPLPLVSSSFTYTVLSQIATTLDNITTTLVSSPISSASTSLDLLQAPTRILAYYLQHIQTGLAADRPEEPPQEDDDVLAQLLAVCSRSLFVLAYLLPLGLARTVSKSSAASQVVRDAKMSWSLILASKVAKGQGKDLVEIVKERLSELILDSRSGFSVIEVINAYSALLDSLPAALGSAYAFSDLLPASSTFDELLDAAHLAIPTASLSVVDNLVASTRDSDTDDLPPASAMQFDDSCCGTFIRAIVALMEVTARDRSWVLRNLWALPHLLIASTAAQDALAVAGTVDEEAARLFSRSIEVGLLERIGMATEGLASYILSLMGNSLDSEWHSKAVARLRVAVPVEGTNDLVSILDKLYRGKGSGEGRSVHERRAFVKILTGCFKYGESGLADAERWLALAMNLPAGSAATVQMIIIAVKPMLYDTPRFQRYQFSLVADISGISRALASTTGLHALRALYDTTPPLDSPIIFLPQQRAMLLLQKFIAWLAPATDPEDEGSEKLGEVLEVLASILGHLIPIVQDLSGAHWDLVFDVIEMNLESASWQDNETIPALYHSCRLLEQIKDLAAFNKELRSISKNRIDKSLELVRDLFVTRPDSLERNAPRSMALDVMTRLIRDLPTKLLTMGDSFDQLVHLLSDTSLSVQQSAFALLSKIAEQHVLNLIVEVELDPESIRVVELPSALAQLLTVKLDLDALNDVSQYYKASTFLLAWLTASQFFTTASPRIKSAYLDHLRRLDLVPGVFLPSIFALLSISDRTRAFDPSPYAVDEFRHELVYEASLARLPVFATYVYFRSLQAFPSLIRFWWDRCQNKQLSLALFNFTSRHFSPVLIAQELAHLRDPDDPAGNALRDNPDFTVRVAIGANEVKARYVVDDETMEIVVRIPMEFPLAAIEVKEVRKIGVTDGQWRAWLIAVQQVVTSQNGLIADALSLFKRNVVLHFEGVEACAICYGVISVVDRTLPTKPCKTCKNLYHPSCLYKWFQSSSGSSCPICRTLF